MNLKNSNGRVTGDNSATKLYQTNIPEPFYFFIGSGSHSVSYEPGW